MELSYPFEPRRHNALTESRQRLDYLLLQDTYMHQVAKPEKVSVLLARLEKLGYASANLSARNWSTAADIYDEFSGTLGFPPGGGRNLEALRDWLNETCEFSFGPGPQFLGIVVTIAEYEEFQLRHGLLAEQFVRTMERSAWYALLVNYPIIVILQSESPVPVPERSIPSIDYMVD